MQWFKDNAVGLLMALIILGGSYGVLYSDVRVSGRADARQDQLILDINSRLLAESTTLQATILRLTSLESQQFALADTNRRMLVALDKIDVLYRTIATSDAVQNEKIQNLVTKIKQVEKNED